MMKFCVTKLSVVTRFGGSRRSFSYLRLHKSRCLARLLPNSAMQCKRFCHGAVPQPKKFTVAVEGNIASGKTTLLQYFSRFEDAMVYQEPVDMWRNAKGHNLLGLMYSDPARWGLAFQTYVQLTMIDIHKRKLPSGKRVKLMERSLFSAKYCFVENLFQSGRMTGTENFVLSEWFDWLVANENPDLDLIVYLRTTPEVSFNRIVERHRFEEATIPLEYVKDLHNLHEDWLITRTRFNVPCPVLVIDANCELDEMEHLFEKHSEEILCTNGKSPQASTVVSSNALIN